MIEMDDIRGLYIQELITAILDGILQVADGIRMVTMIG